MSNIIEITGLTPKIDPVTMQITSGLILSYKKGDNKFEQMELGASTLDVMNMLCIKNFPEAIGKKYEIEIGEDNKLKSMSPVDTRTWGYSDYDRLEKKINEILTLHRKLLESKNQT